MKRSKIEINLEDYLLSKTTYLSGRDEGSDVRKILKLDEHDNDLNEKIKVKISSKMTGINISFFLGLFSKSIEKLKEKFLEKYVFEYEDEETKELIEEDVEYGIKEALDSRSIDEILFGKRSDS
nr:MAG TPA: hypothetical protein [Caudoviricetes sp.]